MALFDRKMSNLLTDKNNYINHSDTVQQYLSINQF